MKEGFEEGKTQVILIPKNYFQSLKLEMENELILQKLKSFTTDEWPSEKSPKFPSLTFLDYLGKNEKRILWKVLSMWLENLNISPIFISREGQRCFSLAIHSFN